MSTLTPYTVSDDVDTLLKSANKAATKSFLDVPAAETTSSLLTKLQGTEADPERIGAEYLPDALVIADGVDPNGGEEGTAATGSITVTGAPVTNDTITVAGQVFTWKTSPVGPYEIQTQSPSFPSSEAGAIINRVNAAGLPVTATTTQTGVVTITANVTGVDGNNYTLAKSGPFTVSGSTLSGGSGGPGGELVPASHIGQLLKSGTKWYRWNGTQWAEDASITDWSEISGRPATFPPTIGSASNQAVAGNDSRLTNARTPTAHKASHATGGSDALTPADIGAATAAQGAKADTALQKASLLTGAGTITPKASGNLDLNALGADVNNTSVNTAIATDPAATRAAAGAANAYIEIITIAGANYDIQLADNGRLIKRTHTSEQTITISDQSVTSWLDGTALSVKNIGSGDLIVTPATGVSIEGVTLLVPGDIRILYRQSLNLWEIV